MKHFLFILAVIFSLGIFLETLVKTGFILVYILALTFLALSWLWRKSNSGFDIFVYILVLLLGIASSANSQVLPTCHINKYLRQGKDSRITLQGFIASQPCARYGQASFIFRTQKIFFDQLATKSCGNLLLKLKAGKEVWQYGDPLVISGRLCRPWQAGNIQGEGYREYLARHGVYSIMKPVFIRRLPASHKREGSILKKIALGLKFKVEDTFDQYLSPLAASILDAMILGERRNIPITVNNAMIKSGTVHILVVSGFNVGIVSFLIILFLKLLRLSRRSVIFVNIPLLILYCLVTGASVPVVRATVMAIVFMTAYLLKREPDIYNSSGLAALFILGFNPRQLFDIGFQLSFLSVIAIVYFSGRLQSLCRSTTLKSKPLKFILDSCLVSFSAWLGTMGPIAYYFKIFSPVTVLANLFVASLAVLITFCGFALVAAGLACPFLAPLFARSNELLVMLLIKINFFLVRLPAAYFCFS
jgi:competence protein ComEC